ncbi:DUF2846 domain-containing protein [Hymenobacter lapidiphilus]|uniref:DUF2846 domain-containing protein n=1 Tax=Hymenobacter sp. CCM 8763 TaxID=2303334 RepID=UPI000E342623|nr:DUF2846 domain-containing protein [Hymenobacter sp. CCM 8763]RFP64363.1 DUF2846 domain-containing protein [Hymenobacter sp. CCM 8763]
MRTSVLLATWLLLSGWVEAPPAPQSTPARLVIYRQREFYGTSYAIKINDKQWGSLPTNRYLQLEVAPGRVKIESVSYPSDNQITRLEVQAGRTYYIKAVEEVDFLTRTLLMAPVSEEQGQRETQRLKLTVPRAK